ncbi:molybdate ABC transporter substrate-binding protein [Nitratiruptor sp. YY09-18]|uniref:molybdate ABC transporter substrate-binding protein n=1 Tax=Nitratiruptor sp. YY09-18 TaxID=2724901 RepID=UPI001915B1CF|nr:molybdate ABC transporter substrate-binding protein [Nitratiruptor sp. YY09-18]BCD67298.1 molybdate transport system substrate-binding protein [Nitratiruptor sp. YY09-18]
MRVAFIVLLFTLFLQAQTLRIAAAANLSFVMQDIVKSFEQSYPDIDVQVITGSSGKLTAQIKRGAPFDIFCSADMRYPDELYKSGLTYTRPLVYAKGALVLVGKNIHTLKDLQKCQKIAIANPKTAPYGLAAKEALEHMGVYEKLKRRFIYGESIAQTTAYTIKVADCGFIAKSALQAKPLQQLHAIDIDPKLYTPIEQGIVILRNNSAARAFFAYIFSKDAAKIFQKYGYIIDD